MKPHRAAYLVSLSILSASYGAHAAECSDDAWFCEKTTTEETTVTTGEESPTDPDAADAPKEPEAAPEPAPPTAEKAEAPAAAKAPSTTTTKKRTIVVREKRPVDEDLTIAEEEAERKWGLNLHVEGVLMGKKKAPDAGMGGFGAGLRYRPVAPFAFEASLDFLGGIDWAGHQRRETAFSLGGLLFFNPRDAVQVYALGGLDFSWARVDANEDRDVNDSEDKHYSYFGMHIGAGLEFRLAKALALNVDLIGFIRGRTDRAAKYSYEFVDERTGRGTNTSGGGLARAGLTFYW